MENILISIEYINGQYAQISLLSSDKIEKSNLIMPKKGIWVSKWIVRLSDGSSKTYHITLFNGKKSDNSQEKTNIQIDDLSIPKERSLALSFKDKVVYSIDPNDFAILAFDFDLGKTSKSKCQMYERIFIIYNHLLDFFIKKALQPQWQRSCKDSNLSSRIS